jgi:hypothetical protein
LNTWNAAKEQSSWLQNSGACVPILIREVCVPEPAFTESRQYVLDFLVERFSLEELKTLVFKLGQQWDEYMSDSKVAFARELIADFERRRALGTLLQAVIKERPDEHLVALLAQFPKFAPREKVQIILPTNYAAQTESVRQLIASKLDIPLEEVRILAAAWGSLRVLISLPEEAARDLAAAAGPPRLVETPIVGVTWFDSLSRASRETWRRIAVSYGTPNLAEIGPGLSWDEHLEKTLKDMEANQDRTISAGERVTDTLQCLFGLKLGSDMSDHFALTSKGLAIRGRGGRLYRLGKDKDSPLEDVTPFEVRLPKPYAFRIPITKINPGSVIVTSDSPFAALFVVKVLGPARIRCIDPFRHELIEYLTPVNLFGLPIVAEVVSVLDLLSRSGLQTGDTEHGLSPLALVLLASRGGRLAADLSTVLLRAQLVGQLVRRQEEGSWSGGSLNAALFALMPTGDPGDDLTTFLLAQALGGLGRFAASPAPSQPDAQKREKEQ